MIKKVTLAFIAVFLLSGCSGVRKGGAHSSAESALIADFEKHVGDRVLFAFDSSALSHHDKSQLRKQGEWLQKHNNFNAVIEGHCDDRGTREYNLALGERRAEAIRKFLENCGIDSNRVTTVSFGKERPAVIGNNEEAWKQNRRGVTVVKSK